jgi:hypothetical protein
MLVLVALGAVAVPGWAVAVVWARQASAALVAVAARVALVGMRAASPTVQLVVMLGRAVLVERAVQLARLARTRRRCLVVMAEPAATLGSLVVALWVRAAWMEHRRRVTADLVALVERAARAAMLVLVALEAVVVPGLAATVVWAWRASAALEAVAARVAPGSMRAASPTGRLVVMPALAALVAAAALLAQLARTPRRCLAVLAGPAVTPARRARARRV